MLFDLQLLGKPDAAGNAGVIENRTPAGASVEEAVRTAKDIVLNTPVPGTYGFRLMTPTTMLHRASGDNIVSGDGSADALEFKLPN
jgi:hypothetical protein